jgi:hypothetical protein
MLPPRQQARGCVCHRWSRRLRDTRASGPASTTVRRCKRQLQRAAGAGDAARASRGRPPAPPPPLPKPRPPSEAFRSCPPRPVPPAAPSELPSSAGDEARPPPAAASAPMLPLRLQGRVGWSGGLEACSRRDVTAGRTLSHRNNAQRASCSRTRTWGGSTQVQTARTTVPVARHACWPSASGAGACPRWRVSLKSCRTHLCPLLLPPRARLDTLAASTSPSLDPCITHGCALFACHARKRSANYAHGPSQPRPSAHSDSARPTAQPPQPARGSPDHLDVPQAQLAVLARGA